MGARWAARPVSFTPAQYEELEQQALIYKYLVAGVPVPPDLVLPIRRGLDALATAAHRVATPGASRAPLKPRQIRRTATDAAPLLHRLATAIPRL